MSKQIKKDNQIKEELFVGLICLLTPNQYETAFFEFCIVPYYLVSVSLFFVFWANFVAPKCM